MASVETAGRSLRRGERPRTGETAERILDSAEALVQQRGFNGFSYADVAAELGLTKASLHYHFAGKAELGRALIGRYSTRFLAALAAIDDGLEEVERKLDAYVELHRGVLAGDRMCLCGMLAAEYETLPEAMQSAVGSFFSANEAWLGAVLEDGRRRGVLAFPGRGRDAARMIVAGLQGAMLLARAAGGVDRFRADAAMLVGSLAPAESRS